MHFFDEMKEYVDFDDEDAERLRDLQPVVSPHFEDVVDGFYDALLNNSHTREVFADDEQLDRLRNSLHEWLEEVFGGTYDADYYEKRRRIGAVHVRVGLPPRFMFGAMNLVRTDLMDILHDEEAEPADEAAVERILDLDLTVMTQAYWDEVIDRKVESASTLATGLAHEIRNPLNTIGLQLTLLERRTTDLCAGDGEVCDAEDEIQPIIDSLRNEIQRIRSLTNDITDFAQPLELNAAWHSVEDIFDELLGAYEASLETLDIELTVDHRDDLEVWCDADRLKQALINLIQNSVQAIENEGEIELGATEGNYGTTLWVEDDGEGIDPDEEYKLFDLFFTTKASGTGLGLPIVRKVVDAHEGSIDVQSEPGEGTRFTLHLPEP